MSRAVVAMLGCLVVGLVLMVAFEQRIPGLLALFAFIVIGVFTIADPEFLGRDDD